MSDWSGDPRNTMMNESARSSSLASSLAQTEAAAATSKARMAQNAATEAQRQNQSAGHAQAQATIESLRQQLEKEKDRNVEAQLAIQEKDALILEWVHSNDAFKKLVRHYGHKLGVSDAERQRDYDDNIIRLAEEDPKFTATELLAKAKARQIP